MARSSGEEGAPRRRSAPSSRPPRSRTTGASSSTSSSDLVEAGRIGRPHGLDGSFHVTRADARLLPLDGIVTVAGEQARIERRAGTEERPILRLEGHTGREAAEALRGEPLFVARTDLPALEPGEYWAHELEGCAVVDGETPVGVVKRLVPLPSCEALAVEREGAPELLVPLVRDAIRKIDVERRRIDVDLEFLGESG